MEIRRKYSDGQIREESRLILTHGRGHLTLAGLMELWMSQSPIIAGSTQGLRNRAESADADVLARDVGKDPEHELAAAFRALEIIVPSGHKSASEVEPYSPEWLADIVMAAAHTLNCTAHEVMHDYTLCAVMHAVAAYHRHNGGVTRRPLETESVLAALKVAKEAKLDV